MTHPNRATTCTVVLEELEELPEEVASPYNESLALMY